MTPEGENRLIGHEGEVLHAYEDTEGLLTIGIGHLIDPKRGGGITQQISRLMFEEDINVATVRARIAFSHWFDRLDPVRQDVIVMLVFNMGVEGVKKFKLMLAAIEAEDWSKAAYELWNSQWRMQVGNKRARDLTTALEKGSWG